MLTIEHPLTGAKLQVANQDFSDEMTWDEGKNACSELGIGWRLPTKEELKAMYEQLHKSGRGNFQRSSYWSSTEIANIGAWTFHFKYGLPYDDTYKSESYCVRAVRDC